MDLLTGATGFLGGYLARRLAAEGRRLRALVRVGTDLKRIPSQVSDVVWGSIDEPDALERAVAGVDVVFHAAARVGGGGTRQLFQTDNVVATELLLGAAARAGVRRLVHVSSAGIYGSDSARGVITEETPLDPGIQQRGAYAWSKAEADRRVRDFALRSRFDAVVVRPGILYGRGATPFFARLHLPLPLGSGRRLIVGSRSALLPLSYVENACEAIALSAIRGSAGRAYNVIDGLVTQGEYLDALQAAGLEMVPPAFLSPGWLMPTALGCEILSRAIKRQLPLSRYRLRRATESLRYDTTAAREELGWTPRIDLAEGLRRTIKGAEDASCKGAGDTPQSVPTHEPPAGANGSAAGAGMVKEPGDARALRS